MPFRQSKRVLFPAPLPPTIATNSPASMRKETSVTSEILPRAFLSFTFFETFTASMRMPPAAVE